jgi:hypothetical protein
LIASGVAALRLAAGLETEVEPIEEAGEADYGLVLAGPYREGLGELALGVLRRIRRVAVLHTPAYFAASEMNNAEAARGKEVRYAAREVPEEIRYYRWVDGNVEATDARRLSPYEQRIQIHGGDINGLFKLQTVNFCRRAAVAAGGGGSGNYRLYHPHMGQ